MIFNVIIEVLKGSNEKYELDEADGLIKLDFVFKDVAFPFYYGYLPGTRGGDGDMLDAAVLTSLDLKRGQEVACRALGYAEIIDRGQVDDKLVVVPVDDSEYKNYQDISDIPQEKLAEWEAFWVEVAKQKNKIMEIKGFHGKTEAEKILHNGKDLPE